MMTLDEAVKKVRPLDEKAMEGARKRWDSIAKPLHSLGELENMLTQIAGITGTPEVRVEKKAVVAMCADNGVVEEGVTQTGQEDDGCLWLRIFGRDYYLLCDVPSVWSRAFSCRCGNGHRYKGPYRS